MKFPKEFERYYSYVDTSSIGTLEPWQYSRLKRLVFNAWMAGRRHEKRGRY